MRRTSQRVTLLMLVLASVTDKLADWVTGVVDDIGLLGIFLLMAPESACIDVMMTFSTPKATSSGRRVIARPPRSCWAGVATRSPASSRSWA